MPFKNKEKKIEYQKRYRQEHPQQRSEADRRYRQKHKQEILEYQLRFHQEHREEILKRGQRYRKENKDKEKQRHKQYYYTIKGYLAILFRSIKQRCDNPKRRDYKYYGGRGIKCLFKSLNDFRDYVINELQIDPRKLQIHRIDNMGHYESENIEFLTTKEHGLKHRKI